jgi:hypothetical protein
LEAEYDELGRIMIRKCIACGKDGRICGKPAIFIDYKRGGMVCQEHAIDLLTSTLTNLQGQIWDLEKEVQNLKNLLINIDLNNSSIESCKKPTASANILLSQIKV